MPVLPVSLLDPVWEQFSVLLPERSPIVPSHPLGCHRRRVPDRVVFAHVVAAQDALGPLPDRIAAHLDRGDDSAATRERLAGLAITGVIARKGSRHR